MISISTELEQYIASHIDPEGEYLNNLYREAQIKLLHGRMSSGHLQGRLLKMLVRLARPKRILEIGTFSGYSAICMAEGLVGMQDVLIHTFEVNDELEDFTRKAIEQSAVSQYIKLHIGDVRQILSTLNETFDLAFIDGDKRQYTEYYRLVMPYIRTGGTIIADNTLWDGHVVSKEYDRDVQTIAVRAFNDVVAADQCVEKVIVPIRDGLTIIHKLKDS